MSLTRIDNPTPSAPVALADYVQILATQSNTILQALRNNSHACIDFTNNFARAGAVFYVAGVLYKAVTDQTISGTPSKYVKITPSGATAAIAYVASLSGVTWNDAQSGYYDGSSNLYVFDEARAVYDGAVSSGKTIEGQIAYIAASLNIKSNLTVLGAATITGNVSIDGGISAPSGSLDIADSVSIVGSLDIDKDSGGIDARFTGASIEGAFTQDQIFSLMNSKVPATVGVRRQVVGAIVTASNNIQVLAYVKRFSSTRLDFYAVVVDLSVPTAQTTVISCTQGNAAAVGTWRAIT